MKKLVSIVLVIALAASMLVHGNAYAVVPGQVIAIEGSEALVQVAQPDQQKPEQPQKASAAIAQTIKPEHANGKITLEKNDAAPTETTLVVIENAFASEEADAPLAQQAEAPVVAIDLESIPVAVESNEELVEGTAADVDEGSIVLIAITQGTHEPHHTEHPPHEERRTRRTRDDAVTAA